MIAGEQSADNHGAVIIDEIKKINKNIQFIGIGGEKMIASGLYSIENINRLSVMGFVEVLKHLFFFILGSSIHRYSACQIQPPTA